MRVVIYTRVSTQDQAREGISLAAQEERLRAYVKAKGWTLVAVEMDDGYSAKDLKRPAMERVLSMVEGEEGDAVLIFELDSLTRSVSDLNQMVALFDRRGVALVSLAESLDATTATGRLMMNLLASVSQWERELTGERTQEAMAYLRKQRKVSCSAVFGFNRCGDRLEEDAEELRTLERMCELRSRGLSYERIAERLNESGVPTKNGGRWWPQTVRRILVRVNETDVPATSKVS